jgi:aspartate 1-decarboxylase
MKTYNRSNRHLIDFAFILLLLAVFFAGSVSLVIMGASQYKKTVNVMNQHAESRTYAAYLSEKINQNDKNHTITYAKVANEPALSFLQEVNGASYSTYIYVYEGYLREITTNTGRAFSPQDGQCVIAASSMNIETVHPNLVCITVSSSKSSAESFYVTTASAQ